MTGRHSSSAAAHIFPIPMRLERAAESPVTAGFRNKRSMVPSPVPMRFAINVKEAVLQVLVRDNNVDQALRALKKKLQREGVFREMKRRRSYEKPSERRAREKSESIRRARKLARKQAQREGLIARKPRPQRAAAGGRR